jgi:hypothetical protein
MADRERVFFNLRHVAPGYTFVAIVFLVNTRLVAWYLFVLKEGSEAAATFLGVSVGLFSLLGGAAVGFLVSETWYFFSQSGRRHERFYIPTRIADLLRSRGVTDDRDVLMLISDDMHHSHSDQRVHSYLERRWDLLNIIGSTIFSIPLGLLVGHALRSILMPESYVSYWNLLWGKLPLHPYDIYYDPFVELLGAVLAVMMWRGLEYVERERLLMWELVIRSNLDKIRHYPEWYRRREKQSEHIEVRDPIEILIGSAKIAITLFLMVYSVVFCLGFLHSITRSIDMNTALLLLNIISGIGQTLFFLWRWVDC